VTWLVESFDVQTDGLLADFDLDILAARAVERAIGARPEVLTPDQIRVVAPLFDIEPDRWDKTLGSLTGVGVFDPDWLSLALVHLVATVVEQSPGNLVGGVWPIPGEVAQALLNRFSAGVQVPDGEVSVGYFA
jgi:hypothetical protein